MSLTQVIAFSTKLEDSLGLSLLFTLFYDCFTPVTFSTYMPLTY